MIDGRWLVEGTAEEVVGCGTGGGGGGGVIEDVALVLDGVEIGVKKDETGELSC